MKKQLKKPFLMMAVTALVLVGTLKVGGAMAYFTTYSTASGSVQMNMGFTQTIPHEEVDSRGKHVSVENTGEYDCFVRVRAFAPSDITLSYQPEDSGCAGRIQCHCCGRVYTGALQGRRNRLCRLEQCDHSRYSRIEGGLS